MTLERDEEVDEILRLIRLLPENDMIEEVQSSGKATMEEAQATANALRGRTQRRNSCPLLAFIVLGLRLHDGWLM